ncbi:MAG TPA: hypothetical protein VHM70_11170 [Polyangiaceae bacterium]|nr:hypothetical protein [Polyangiaceae bacterium]
MPFWSARFSRSLSLAFAAGPKHSRRARIAWLALGLLTVVGCATATFVIQQYQGAPLPANRIAILRILGGGDSFIAALDGEQLGFKLDDPRDRIHVEMLPGRHEISLGQGDEDRVVTRAFQAQVGHVYRAVIVRDKLARDVYGHPNWTVGVFEVEPDSDELLRDISENPEMPRPANSAATAAATSTAPVASTAPATSTSAEPIAPSAPSASTAGPAASASAPSSSALPTPSAPTTPASASSAPAAPSAAPSGPAATKAIHP